MKVNWTPEPAHTHRPEHSRSTLAWSMWIVSMCLLTFWVVSLVLWGLSTLWTVLLLGMFVGLNLATIVFGFKYVEDLEPWLIARDRVLRGRGRRVRRVPPPEEPSRE
jgi:hypothetical protein